MASEHRDGEGGVYLGMLWAGTIDLLVNNGHLSLVKLPVSRSRHRDTSRTFLLDRAEIDEVIPQWREKREVEAP